MNIEEKKEYTLITSTENSFNEFMTNLKKLFTNVNNYGLFIKFSDNLSPTKEEISLLLPYSEQFQENGITFVVIFSEVDMDYFPEEFNIVPTLLEAEDVLDMENIQRDLDLNY